MEPAPGFRVRENPANVTPSPQGFAMIDCAVRLGRVPYASAVLSCLFLLPALPAHAQRLPQTVTPEHYALTLTPDLKAATFTGVEQIDLEVKEPTTTITLNSAEIEFQSV